MLAYGAEFLSWWASILLQHLVLWDRSMRFGHVAAVFFSNLVVRCFLLFLCPFTFGSAAFVSLWVLLSFLCGDGSENCSTVYELRVFLQPARAGWVLGRGGWVVWFFCYILCFRRLLCILVVFTLQDKVQGRVNDFEDGPWCGLDLVWGWRTFGMVSCCEWVFEVWDAPRDQQPTSHRLHAVHGFRPSLNAILCMSHHTTMNFVEVRNWQGLPRCYTSHPERMSFGTRLASRHFIHYAQHNKGRCQHLSSRQTWQPPGSRRGALHLTFSQQAGP